MFGNMRKKGKYKPIYTKFEVDSVQRHNVQQSINVNAMFVSSIPTHRNDFFLFLCCGRV